MRAQVMIYRERFAASVRKVQWFYVFRGVLFGSFAALQVFTGYWAIVNVLLWAAETGTLPPGQNSKDLQAALQVVQPYAEHIAYSFGGRVVLIIFPCFVHTFSMIVEILNVFNPKGRQG